MIEGQSTGRPAAQSDGNNINNGKKNGLKIKIALFVSGLTILVGFLVMIGWLFDVTILTSILPQWIRMKFATALCFVFSGIVIYFLTFKKDERKEIRQISLTVFPMLLVLIMGTLFLGSVFGFQTGMENIGFIDIHELNTPIFQGRPSVASMVCFLLIASSGILFNFNRSTKKILTIIGFLIGFLGLTGVIGYLIDQPVLYYEIPGLSNAIAFHTTVLFSFLGTAIFLISRDQD